MSEAEIAAAGRFPANSIAPRNDDVLINSGGADPAANVPSRRNYTVSQVPFPHHNLANPGPLGLLGFAITTFVLGALRMWCRVSSDLSRMYVFCLHIFRLSNSNPEGKVGPDQAVFGLTVFMGGMAQFIAGVMEFAVGNTFGTTVHCTYGAFWLSYAMFLVPSLGIKSSYGGDMRAYTFALGIYLILWCFITLLFLVAALRTNVTILGVLFFLVLAYLFLSIAQFTATEHPTASVRLNKAGGAFAVVCAFLAFYGGASGLMVPDNMFVKFPLGVLPSPEMPKKNA